MRRVRIDDVLLGERVGKAIFSPDGKILLSQGVELTESYLEKLKGYGINEIYIDDEVSRGIELHETIAENTRLEAKSLVKDLMGKYRFTNSFNSDKVIAVVDEIIDELLASNDILLSLSDIKSVDDYTFEHSVNVCIISLIIGIGLKFPAENLRELGIGAILHDIGKLMIPDEILKKPSQLTVDEFEEIKRHTVYGYEILKRNRNINTVSAYIAFAHHERFDGSGYPMHIKAESIHQCARIVAVADVYDALTSDRVYRRKLKAHEVFEYITALGSHHFDKAVVDTFAKYVAVYPIGTGVILNNRQRGLVARINGKFPTRPVVRVIYDENNQNLVNYYEIDLSQRFDLYILDSCEI